MAANVVWDDEAHSIIRIDLSGFTWAEYHAAVQEAVQTASQQSQRVDVIINNPGSLPSGNPLPHLRESIHQLGQIPTLGTIVSINSQRLPGFVRRLVNVVLHSFGVDEAQTAAGFENTLDEARERIRELRDEAAKA